MPRTTRRFETERRGQTGSRIGLLFGAVALFWSAQLLGREEGVTTGRQDGQESKPPLHILVVSIPDRKLAVTQDGHLVKVYAVAVGAAVSPSPTGEMKIVNKVVDPTYYHRGKVVPPGKSNPVGNRWMGLNQKGYGIHGTNVPSSIGKAASHGCIRMRRQDLEELFNLVRVGDVVEIHGERDLQTADLFAPPAVVVQSSPRPAVDRSPELSPVVMAVLAEGN
jgi:hypothetical protein